MKVMSKSKEIIRKSFGEIKQCIPKVTLFVNYRKIFAYQNEKKYERN